MWQWEVRADVVSNTAAISACEKCEDYMLSFEPMKVMRQGVLRLDAVPYSAAISAREQGAERLLPVEHLKGMRQ